ncbi:MAG: T9SS type A sorting domain-containing protein [Bacteroidota bacterium]
MKVKHLLLFVLLFSCTQSFAQLYRLKSMAHCVYTGLYFSLKDSTDYTYSGTHTSFLQTTGLIQFDSAFRGNYTVGALVPDTIFRTGQTFDADTNITYSLMQYYDTTAHMWIDSVQTYNNYITGTHLLNTQTTSLWNRATSTWIGSVQYLYGYTGANVLISTISQLYNTGTSAWVNNTLDSIYYGVNTLDSMGIHKVWNTGTSAWVNSTEHNHFYNINNLPLLSIFRTWNIDSGKWYNSMKYLYGFDAFNKQTWQRIQLPVSLTSLAFKEYMVDSFYYNTFGSKTLTLHQTWNTTLSAYTNFSDTVYTYDANNNFLSKVDQLWYNTTSSFINELKEEYTYDVNNNMITYQTSAWNRATSQWQFTPGQNPDISNRYHYEQYLGINNVAAPSNTIKLYPNPATQFVQMNIEWKNPQPFTIAIFDVQGRLWRQWSEAATDKYQTAVFVDQLPSGNYFMNIIGNNNERSTQQFVVAH